VIEIPTTEKGQEIASLLAEIWQKQDLMSRNRSVFVNGISRCPVFIASEMSGSKILFSIEVPCQDLSFSLCPFGRQEDTVKLHDHCGFGDLPMIATSICCVKLKVNNIGLNGNFRIAGIRF
jgi:hypothetical protein